MKTTAVLRTSCLKHTMFTPFSNGPQMRRRKSILPATLMQSQPELRCMAAQLHQLTGKADTDCSARTHAQLTTGFARKCVTWSCVKRMPVHPCRRQAFPFRP